MKTCTYPSGAVVTFDTALVLPLPNDPTWSFTVTSGGQPCLSYVDSPSGDGFALTVKGQTFKEALAGVGLQITCPDQSVVATSNAFDLVDCDSDAGIFGGNLPGYFFSDSSTNVSFGLVGAGSVNIFRCRKP